MHELFNSYVRGFVYELINIFIILYCEVTPYEDKL